MHHCLYSFLILLHTMFQSQVLPLLLFSRRWLTPSAIQTLLSPPTKKPYQLYSPPEETNSTPPTTTMKRSNYEVWTINLGCLLRNTKEGALRYATAGQTYYDATSIRELIRANATSSTTPIVSKSPSVKLSSSIHFNPVERLRKLSRALNPSSAANLQETRMPLSFCHS